MSTAIDTLMEEYSGVRAALMHPDSYDVSLFSAYGNTFRKVLLISCASYFEGQITMLLKDFCRKKSGGDERLAEFLHRQAIDKKYHTLFHWGTESPGRDANQFFKLFGGEFSNYIKAELAETNTHCGRDSEEVKDSITAFIEIGHLRNVLAHNNFAEYTYEHKTPEDIYDMYRKALLFVEYLHDKLQ
jgi:hypothetical protein